MKKILIIVLAFSLFSCNKEESSNKLDPNAMISLRPEVGTKADYLPSLEIVKQAHQICFYNEEIGTNDLRRNFIPEHKDLVNVRLLMWGTDIIDQYGQYVTEFINGRDFIINRLLNAPTDWPPRYDTIAYISNRVIQAARTQIKAAYDAGDYARCYDLFNSAFTFRPVTGEEWRELKANGLN